MSLRPDDRSGRSRAKSPGRERDRSRSRSNVRAPREPSPPRQPSYDYVSPPAVPGANIPPSYGNGVTSPSYETRTPQSAGAERSNYFAPSTTTPGAYPAPPAAGTYPPPPASSAYSSTPSYPPPPGIPYPSESEITMGDYKDFPPHERPGYQAQQEQYSSNFYQGGNDHRYDDHNSSQYSRHNSYDTYPSQPPRNPQPPSGPRPPQPPRQQTYPNYTQEPVTNDSRSASYNYQYAQPPEKVTYTQRVPTDPPQRQYSSSNQNYYQEQPRRSYSQSTYDQQANLRDITPYDQPLHSNKHRLGADTRGGNALAPGMGLLSVGGSKPITAGELPPPSPLLEAYRGTYQQMPDMPLALRGLDDDEDDLSDLEPLSPTMSRTGGKGGVKFSQEAVQEEKRKKSVKVYDPEADAKKLSKALSHSKVDGDTICDILPVLTHDQIVYLTKEYKKQVKVQGKGVNLSKHLKTKVTGNFGKAAYVTALGRWESEGYWANFFYQSHGSRRELLIESLMGRTNAEIWNIKDEFRDKRYSDDLVKCMEKELKMDKFRTAVLLVLEERRQEEQDVYPMEYRTRDAEVLHKALTAPKGGESTMLEIIVLRSDAHLREVLKIYERSYQENFPRAALKKSNNLVGEVIAHILNGVINKPARDALLLRHAIDDVAEKNKEEELRYELLISRLVRFHWDKAHMMRVKREYEAKYDETLEESIEGAAKGDFAEFMSQLCTTK